MGSISGYSNLFLVFRINNKKKVFQELKQEKGKILLEFERHNSDALTTRNELVLYAVLS